MPRPGAWGGSGLVVHGIVLLEHTDAMQYVVRAALRLEQLRVQPGQRCHAVVLGGGGLVAPGPHCGHFPGSLVDPNDHPCFNSLYPVLLVIAGEMLQHDQVLNNVCGFLKTRSTVSVVMVPFVFLFLKFDVKILARVAFADFLEMPELTSSLELVGRHQSWCCFVWILLSEVFHVSTIEHSVQNEGEVRGVEYF